MDEKERLTREAIAKLKEAQYLDSEGGHMEADKVLCDLLIQLGYSEVVELYNKIFKYYA